MPTKPGDITQNTVEFKIGNIQDTVEVGNTKYYTINGKNYAVNLVVVSIGDQTGEVTKLTINGEVTNSLSEGESWTLEDGTNIKILDLMLTKSGDIVDNMVEFQIGNIKDMLEVGATKTYNINGKSYDVAVTIIGCSAGSVTKFIINDEVTKSLSE